MDKPCAVYRFYNAAGEVLYVGITSALLVRFHAHDTTQAWWDEVATVTVEHYPTKEAARARELALIQTLRPPHNGDRLKGGVPPQPYRAFVPNSRGGGKTHCLHGHPFDSINTYITPKGDRACRQCGTRARERAARLLAEARAASEAAQ